MPYQVDQSNKIESTGDTALALSNDREYMIRIPAREKDFEKERVKARLGKWPRSATLSDGAKST